MQRAREDQGFLLNRDSECRVTTARLEKGLAVSGREIKRGRRVHGLTGYDAMMAQTMSFFCISIVMMTAIADVSM